MDNKKDTKRHKKLDDLNSLLNLKDKEIKSLKNLVDHLYGEIEDKNKLSEINEQLISELNNKIAAMKGHEKFLEKSLKSAESALNMKEIIADENALFLSKILSGMMRDV